MTLSEIHVPVGFDGVDGVKAFTGWDPSKYHPTSVGCIEWERDKIRRIDLPAPLKLDWDRETSTSKIGVHGNVAYYLKLALDNIHACGLWNALGTFGGGYTWRVKRSNPSQLSMHALGLAVDFSPSENPMGMPPEESFFGKTPEGRAVVRILDAYGWKWGGRFSNPDPMHFQFGEGY